MSFCRTAVLALLLFGYAARGAADTDWAKAMFDQTTHDFGMVPRGSEAEYRFTLENIYVEDAHIKSVSSSCHCTSVALTKPSLKTHEKSQVVATLNTRQFTGTKEATIRVVFDKPFAGEVQLHVHSYIRTDVVLDPGSVQFGEVTEGSAVTRTITLRHAGNPNWEIKGIEKEDPDVDIEIRPVSAETGQSTYQLTFTLKASAPEGYIRRPVVLLTNDQNPNAQRVLVPLEGVVAPAVSIRPKPLAFGQVAIDREVTRNIVIQGKDSFQILKLTGPDDRFGVSPSVKFNTPSRLHVLPITFAAGSKPGKLEGEILIQTDIGGGKSLRVNVTGEVVDKSPTASPAPAAEGSTATAETATETAGHWRSAKK